MQCSCGGETQTREHQVKTLDKAIAWYPEKPVDVLESLLPVKVVREVCVACGRQLIRDTS